jgi:hypothetical protein
MGEGASPPPPQPPREPGGSHAAGEGAQTQERYGPIALERLVKDDGRSLILYRHDAGSRDS